MSKGPSAEEQGLLASQLAEETTQPSKGLRSRASKFIKKYEAVALGKVGIISCHACASGEKEGANLLTSHALRSTHVVQPSIRSTATLPDLKPRT